MDLCNDSIEDRTAESGILQFPGYRNLPGHRTWYWSSFGYYYHDKKVMVIQELFLIVYFKVFGIAPILSKIHEIDLVLK